MKSIFSIVFLCLLAGTVSAKFAHDGPTPEYANDFLSTMEGIHADAWESLKPFLDSLDEYVNQSVTAWTKYADEHKSSKAGRQFWSGAKHNMSGEFGSILASVQTKIEEMLASYQSKMSETAASWKGKHADYDIEAKIGELQGFADEALMGFKSKMGHTSKSGRKLNGLWESYSAKKNGTKPSFSGKTFSHSYDYSTKKADFEAKLAGYKADVEAKIAGYKADVDAKIADWKASKATIKADIDTKIAGWKASKPSIKADIDTKIADWKASKPSFSAKFGKN
jgi:hypothetical protein